MLERELFTLLEGTADAAFVVDPQGTICSWNRAAERLFGYPAADVMNKSCNELFQGRGGLGTVVCADECEVLECVAARREIPNYDLEVTMRSGEPLWVNISILVFQDGRTGRKLVVHRLLADGKSPSEVARELHITARTLRNHVHHANQKLHTRNRLEAVMHALRRGLI